MIIHHSKKILEQLSEIEELIQKVENLMKDNGIEGDCEKLLRKIVHNQEARNASRIIKDN